MTNVPYAIKGDRVRVAWNDGQIEGIVEDYPQPMNNWTDWVIVSDDGTIRHIKQYECITVLNRKANDDKAA